MSTLIYFKDIGISKTRKSEAQDGRTDRRTDWWGARLNMFPRCAY